jgi:hypothetical protein
MDSRPKLSVAGTRSVVSDESLNIKRRSLSLRGDEASNPLVAIDDIMMIEEMK